MDPHDSTIGLEVEDLLSSAEFLERVVRPRSSEEQIGVLQRLTGVLVDEPGRVLQELVHAALAISNADSAGISLEAIHLGGQTIFQWVALAGTYAPFQGAMLPRGFLPCELCHQRQTPQRLRVPSAYIRDLMHIDTVPVTDGIAIPWNAEGRSATLWVVAHERTDAFDMDDYRVLQVFANFAAMAYRSILRNRRNLLQVIERTSDSTASLLADGISNPLQGVTNCLFLAQTGGPEATVYAREAETQLQRLSELVKDMLDTPAREALPSFAAGRMGAAFPQRNLAGVSRRFFTT